MYRMLLGCVLLSVVIVGCGSAPESKDAALAHYWSNATASAIAGAPSATARVYSIATSVSATATAASINNPRVRRVLFDELDRAEQQWQSAGVVSYQITVSKGDIWGGPQMNTIRVVKGQVATQLPTCQALHTPNCLLPSDKPENYTVLGLFQTVRRELSNPERIIYKVMYDQVYGFPRDLSTSADPYKVSDSYFVQHVDTFTILP